MFSTAEFKQGLAAGMPIGIGYVPVAFTFGFMAVSGGLPVWAAVLISFTNLTSAGQFAGTNLIVAGAGSVEVALTTFVINLRYILMSLALSQKIDAAASLKERLIWSFGITDETFVVASVGNKTLTSSYMFGLIALPILGWNAGTLLGGCISQVLPEALQNAMGIGLYAMFVALIVPAARDSARVLLIILIAVAVNCLLMYIPAFSFISSGFRVILATIAASAVGAFLYPEESGEGGETS